MSRYSRYKPPTAITVVSKSDPTKLYRMVWTPVSGWVHADNTCPARVDDCRHKKEARKRMTSLVPRTPEGQNLPAIRGEALLIEYDPQAIRAGVDIEIAAKWAYNLGSSGKGVGVRGVEEGVRLLASRGEVIRVGAGDVVIVREDEYEALINVTATRYVIEPETGREIRLDSATRAKRAPKVARHSEDWVREHPRADPMYFDDKWYEKGVAKASRNAALALMPSNVKTAILRAGLDAIEADKKGKTGALDGGQAQQAPRQSQQAQRPANNQRAAPRGSQERPAPPAGEAPTREQMIAEIDRMLLDCKNTWPAGDWLTLYTGIRQTFTPKAAQFEAANLTDAQLPKAIEWLRKKRGEGDLPGAVPPAAAEEAGEEAIDGEVVGRGEEEAP